MVTEAKITVVLNGRGGVLDTTIITRAVRHGAPENGGSMQRRIHGAIAAWQLAPGDTIEILGNEAAFALFEGR